MQWPWAARGEEPLLSACWPLNVDERRAAAARNLRQDSVPLAERAQLQDLTSGAQGFRVLSDRLRLAARLRYALVRLILDLLQLVLGGERLLLGCDFSFDGTVERRREAE